MLPVSVVSCALLEFVDHLSGSIGRQPLQADGRTCDERHRRSRRWQQAVLDEPAHHAADDAMQKFLQMLTVRRINLMETRSVALQRIDPVQDDHVPIVRDPLVPGSGRSSRCSCVKHQT